MLDEGFDCRCAAADKSSVDLNNPTRMSVKTRGNLKTRGPYCQTNIQTPRRSEKMLWDLQATKLYRKIVAAQFLPTLSACSPPLALRKVQVHA